MAQSIQQFKLWQRLRNRLISFIVVAVLFLIFLIFRLVEIQIVEGVDYYEKSQRVIRKVVAWPAPRGEMFDRNYTNRETAKPIVSNTATINLIAIPSHFKRGKLRPATRNLERLLGFAPKTLESKITKAKLNKNEEIVFIENLTKTQITKIGTFHLNFEKFIMRASTSRKYNIGNQAAHVTGYIGPPTKADIEKRGIRSYQYVGKNGLEAYYDNILRGTDGEFVQIRTARGDKNPRRALKNFVPGNNLILTIDIDIQKAASKALGDKTGAVIALKPSNGEILALVSQPDYNPNILVSPDKTFRRGHVREIKKNKAELNRAISAKYPSASTFKPLVALAGLEERRFSPEQTFHCPGKFVLKSTYKGFPDSTYFCWNTHRTNSLIGAIAQSCSVYFYQLGYKIGSQPIIKYARYFKLDQKTDIDLPAEIRGFVPTPLWKEKYYNQRWYDGDTVNLSIGQGFIETTLVGLVNFYAAIAADGVVYRPHLVKEIRYAENDAIKERIEPETLYELPISKTTLATIKQGIRAVTVSGTTRGVLKRSNLIAIAGKTGTVQTRSNERLNKKTQHAWYIGYGPFDGNLDDIMVVGVFVERGIGGAVGAAPVAQKVFLEYTKILKKKAAKK